MMYQGNGSIVSSKSMYSSERESGLILSTDAKPRLKWTPELHERFIDAVQQLGGPDKATPKTIMRLMGIPGLTLYHLKSHLQKFRLSKNLQSPTNATNAKSVLGCHVPMENRPSEGNLLQVNNLNPQPNKSIQIGEALQMQIEVQRRLHEQLEVQRHLQLRIEAQGKYLQTVLEKAQESLSKQNPNSGQTGIEIESAKLQLSELVSKVSNEYLQNNSSFQIFEELNEPNNNMLQLGDASFDSCLTACEAEGLQKEAQKLNQVKNEWDSNLLSIGLSMDLNARDKKADSRNLYVKLDLNVKDVNNDGAEISRKFDLNGFSWN